MACNKCFHKLGTIFHEDTINAESYITGILLPFFAELTEEEKTRDFFNRMVPQYKPLMEQVKRCLKIVMVCGW